MSDSTQFERMSKQGHQTFCQRTLNKHVFLVYTIEKIQLFNTNEISLLPRRYYLYFSRYYIYKRLSFFYLRCGTSLKFPQIIIAIKTISKMKHKFHTQLVEIFFTVGNNWGCWWEGDILDYSFLIIYQVSPQTPCPVCFSATP